jgi:hypothetical protein
MALHHAKLAAYERELIGLMKVVRHWHRYLWPRKFIVRTDHFSLKYLLDQRLSTVPQHNQVSKLFGYQFSVEFNPGRQNVATDALSRRDKEMSSLCALSLPTFELYDQLLQESTTPSALVTKHEQIAAGTAGQTGRSSTTSSCTRGRSSCRTRRHPGRRSFSKHMAWAMRVSRRLFIDCVPHSSPARQSPHPRLH